VMCHGAVPKLHVPSHRSQRTRQPDAIVLSNQETLGYGAHEKCLVSRQGNGSVTFRGSVLSGLSLY